MRQLATFDDERAARRFADVLCAREIDVNVSAGREGNFAVWVIDEKDLEAARAAYALFDANPQAPEHLAAEGCLEKKLRTRATDEKKSRRQVVDMRKRFRRETGSPPAITLGLVVVSVIATFVVTFQHSDRLFDALAIGPMVEAYTGDPFHAVLHGQPWRLITPIFVHLSFLHILFNMWWLVDLGSILENRIGQVRFGLLVLFTAAISNAAQYAVTGSPAFGGMSGVIYALVGYIWARDRLDGSFGLSMPQSSMLVLLVWLALGFTGMLGNVANITHLGGLLSGAGLGAVAALARRR
jgi:GlpG protein